jgi:inosine/xanthosine triphosphatase
MRVFVGSQRKSKLAAVEAVLQQLSGDLQISGVSVPSEVSEQPVSLKEVLAGAKHRARNALGEGGDLGVGIEGGVFRVVDGRGFYQICGAALWDGIAFSTGFSSAFELPEEVGTALQESGNDLNSVLHSLGYTDDPEIGLKEGAVGLFTGGRLHRKEFMEQALRMALWIRVGHTSPQQGES